MINIVIPMAGLGSRFPKDRYYLPKPLIDINGKPMIARAIESLDIDGQYHFIMREDEFTKITKHLSYTLESLKKHDEQCTIIKKSILNIVENNDTYEWVIQNYLNMLSSTIIISKKIFLNISRIVIIFKMLQ